jgi:hypothetical protein
MSLSSGRAQLANAFKKLKLEWLATENVWRDQVRQDFNDTYWEPLEARLASVLTAIDRLDQSMGQMKHYCE